MAASEARPYCTVRTTRMIEPESVNESDRAPFWLDLKGMDGNDEDVRNNFPHAWAYQARPPSKKEKMRSHSTTGKAAPIVPNTMKQPIVPHHLPVGRLAPEFYLGTGTLDRSGTKHGNKLGKAPPGSPPSREMSRLAEDLAASPSCVIHRTTKCNASCTGEVCCSSKCRPTLH